MRRLISIAAVAAAAVPALVAPAAPAVTDPCSSPPAEAASRVERILPEPAGTESRYCIFFGPYVIPGGHDLSRVDFDFALADGFIVAGAPSPVNALGEKPSNQDLHIHHSHWWFIDPDDRDAEPLPWMRWISGSGEEVTRGDFRTVAAADPAGPMYGIRVAHGDRVAMVNMLHNKRTRAETIWIKVDLVFAHGTREQIAAAQTGTYAGRDFHNLTGVLHGGGFNVERTGGKYVYPRDLTPPATEIGAGVSPGVGDVWVAPFDGTLVLGAGHIHPGGERIIVTNLGTATEPCGNDRSDGIPGTTLYELDLIDRVAGARFTEDFQIEITRPGFRAKVRAGDRIALNAVYDATSNAWWDAMSFTGMYIDEDAPPLAGEGCAVTDLAGGDHREGIPNRDWAGSPDRLCGPGLGGPCDRPADTPLLPGVETDRVTIAAYTYWPGGLGAGTGPVVVKQGGSVRFGNADMGTLVRHTVTSCAAPCNGTYVANYPLPDGAFDSGYLGWEPTTGGRQVPAWTLDTSTLPKGVHTYFCRVHPWMRGAVEVV